MLCLSIKPNEEQSESEDRNWRLRQRQGVLAELWCLIALTQHPAALGVDRAILPACIPYNFLCGTLLKLHTWASRGGGCSCLERTMLRVYLSCPFSWWALELQNKFLTTFWGYLTTSGHTCDLWYQLHVMTGACWLWRFLFAVVEQGHCRWFCLILITVYQSWWHNFLPL